jgi:2-polyprenyl-6-methoxyphenol hydroxylase-like FAD-dependent oxidoreductase
MLPQSDTERLLEEHLASRGVQVEREVEMTGFVADVTDVAVSLRHADGSIETTRTPWLIGCDGAHSAVRHGLKMEFEGSTLPSNWLLADVHLTGVPTPANELAMFFDAAGPLAIFPISPGRYRVIANAAGKSSSDAPTEPTLADVQAEIDRRGLSGMRASAPIWISAFHINERKVADYRAGRVFLAGDAAHVHSPAGGQGMNTGMQDAFNLAWKLALVVHGDAAEEPLLSSYSTERSAVGRQVLADAGRLTAAALLQGEWLQSIRNHVASLLLGLGPVRNAMTQKLAELSIGYPESPLTDNAQHAHASPAPGERAPVVTSASRVGAGDRPRFALFAESSPGSAALMARFGALVEPVVRAPFGEGATWLVRPDGYVACVASRDDWSSIATYLERLAVPGTA